MSDLIYFIDWDIITLIGRCVIVTFLFDWMSSLFVRFVLVIPSPIILNCDENTFRFVVLVLMFVVSIMFLIN